MGKRTLTDLIVKNVTNILIAAALCAVPVVLMITILMPDLMPVLMLASSGITIIALNELRKDIRDWYLIQKPVELKPVVAVATKNDQAREQRKKEFSVLTKALNNLLNGQESLVKKVFKNGFDVVMEYQKKAINRLCGWEDNANSRPPVVQNSSTKKTNLLLSAIKNNKPITFVKAQARIVRLRTEIAFDGGLFWKDKHGNFVRDKRELALVAAKADRSAACQKK